MIRALRRRFIAGAMAAFGILMVLLVGTLATVGSMQLRRETEGFLEYALSEEKPDWQRGKRDFPVGPMPHGGGHYLISVDAKGRIGAVEARGIWNADADAAREAAARALETGETSGKIGSSRFLLRRNADGSARMALADFSMQTHLLTGLLLTAVLICLGCMVVLFLILLPVSRRVVHGYAANIERQKQFITNAGHEIKTPLAIIMSNVDALELMQGESKWSRNIRGQALRMGDLIRQLLFMARLDEQGMSPEMEEVRLDELLRTEAEAYREPMEARGLRFDCAIEDGICMRGNRAYLRQLVRMLMDNAVRYASENGDVRLRLEGRRRRLRLTLENSVDALPECAPDLLFDRFSRGDRARTQQSGGYGVGLSAARAIVEMHGGRIDAEYVDAGRIRFAVELPRRA